MTRTASRLADGRELLYFDEKPGVDHSQPDRRDIAAARTASEIRYDVLVDQWVVIAGHRQTRTHLPPTTQCLLCPSTPDRLTEVPAFDYDVVVFENRFASLSHGLEPGPGGLLQDPAGDGLFVRRPGLGRCEVVCFTADHDTSFAHLSPRRVATVLEAWTDRTRELSALPGVEQVFVFEGTVASAATASKQRDCRYENPPPSPCPRNAVRLRRLPLPTRRDCPGGPLVPALRAVLSRRRGTPRRAWYRADHVTIYRWVQRFTPLLAEAAHPAGTLSVIAGSWTRPM